MHSTVLLAALAACARVVAADAALGAIGSLESFVAVDAASIPTCPNGSGASMAEAGIADGPVAEAGGCVDVMTDWTNCGFVGHRCPRPMWSLPTCSAGTCGFECSKVRSRRPMTTLRLATTSRFGRKLNSLPGVSTRGCTLRSRRNGAGAEGRQGPQGSTGEDVLALSDGRDGLPNRPGRPGALQARADRALATAYPGQRLRVLGHGSHARIVRRMPLNGRRR